MRDAASIDDLQRAYPPARIGGPHEGNEQALTVLLLAQTVRLEALLDRARPLPDFQPAVSRGSRLLRHAGQAHSMDRERVFRLACAIDKLCRQLTERLPG